MNIISQRIFSKRKFIKIALNPPNFNPGSWCGAGKIWIDRDTDEYWLTSRPREGEVKRGFAVEIYRSSNGVDYNLVNWITKEELSEMIGKAVQSIENQQLIRDPLTGKYHLYLSIDVFEENIAGRVDKIYASKWETYLLTADDPRDSWNPYGFVLRGDQEYDSGESRDCSIDIIDGLYFCLYKARPAGKSRVNTALAISSDGKNWRKFGLLSIDGERQPEYFLLNGSIFPSSLGPMFIGMQTTEVIKGAALSKEFAAYIINYRELRLEKVFIGRWIPSSRYEHPEYPIHTYSTLTYDYLNDRWLIFVEAVDPIKSLEPGLNTEVDRVLLYFSK
ncbi:MAG TPA: hypothetical protein ENG40_00035 [Thermoprotei archaeon]|nr:hypothetical protein [Thermoprotei archaeon]